MESNNVQDTQTFQTILKLKVLFAHGPLNKYGVAPDTGLPPLNLNELTKSELKAAGFGLWSDESQLYLIPHWLLPFLPEEVDVEDISGKKVTKSADIDDDHRFGFLAYGVRPSS